MPSKKQLKWFVLLGAVIWGIALFFKVNFPELRDAASTYVDIISFVMFLLLLVFLVFKGKFKLK